MPTLLTAVVLITGVIVASFWRRRRFSDLPDLSDDLFVAEFADGRRSFGRDEILEERRNVSSTWGIPYVKLDPRMRLPDFSRRTDYGLTLQPRDLLDELARVLERAGVAVPQNPPQEIAEIMELLIEGRRRLRGRA